MTAIGTAAAEQLITRAAAAGITAEQIAAEVRLRVDALDVMSGRDRQKVVLMIEAAEQRAALIERVAHLARLSGRDADAIRGKVAGWSAERLAGLVADSERYLRGQGIDIRTDTEKQAAAAAKQAAAQAPATDAQVSYLVKLLKRRASSGEGDGYAPTRSLYADGTVDVAAVRRLTKQAASQLIDSLTGSY